MNSALLKHLCTHEHWQSYIQYVSCSSCLTVLNTAYCRSSRYNTVVYLLISCDSRLLLQITTLYSSWLFIALCFNGCHKNHPSHFPPYCWPYWPRWPFWSWICYLLSNRWCDVPVVSWSVGGTSCMYRLSTRRILTMYVSLNIHTSCKLCEVLHFTTI